MHDLGYLLASITGLIGILITAYNAFEKNKQSSRAEKEKEQKEEREELKKDAEMYRQRWLEAEKGNDKLQKEIAELRKKGN